MNEQYYTGVYVFNGEEHIFNFRSSLSAVEKVHFVNWVTDVLVGDDYNYVLKDMIFDFGIINTFTDVDVSYIFSDERDDSISAIEELISKSNIIDIVIANIDEDVIDELRNAVDLNIEYKTGVRNNSISDSIAKLLNTLERKVNGFDLDADGTMKVINMLNGISDELTMDKMFDAFKKSYANDDVDNKFEPDDSMTSK